MVNHEDEAIEVEYSEPFMETIRNKKINQVRSRKKIDQLANQKLRRLPHAKNDFQ